MTHRMQAYGEAVVTVLLMSTVPVVIRGISADPWVIGISRLLIACGFLFVVLGRRRWWTPLNVRGRCGLLAIGVTFALHWMCYFWSIKLASAQIATIGVSTYGIFVSVLGAYFLRHQVRPVHAYGLGLALCGTAMVISGMPQAAESSHGIARIAGFLIGVLSGLFYAILPILHQTFKHIPTASRTLGQNLFALLVFLPAALLGNWQLGMNDWAGLVYLGLIATVLCHTLWIRATTVLPTTHSGIIYYLYVPGGCLLGYFFLGERLGLIQIGGAVLIIIGSLIGIAGPMIRGARQQARSEILRQAERS